MPIAIKEINVKLQVDEAKTKINTQQPTIDKDTIDSIVEKCVKEVIRKLKNQKQR